MNGSAINISSVKREQIGTNKPHDFIVKFNPPLKLDQGFKHYLALDRLSMTHFTTSELITTTIHLNIPMMEQHGKQLLLQMECIPTQISMIYIHQYIDQKSHHSTDSKGAKVYSINLSFILSTYRVSVTINLI